jgi:hypothetical protein
MKTKGVMIQRWNTMRNLIISKVSSETNMRESKLNEILTIIQSKKTKKNINFLREIQQLLSNFYLTPGYMRGATHQPYNDNLKCLFVSLIVNTKSCLWYTLRMKGCTLTRDLPNNLFLCLPMTITWNLLGFRFFGSFISYLLACKVIHGAYTLDAPCIWTWHSNKWTCPCTTLRVEGLKFASLGHMNSSKRMWGP